MVDGCRAPSCRICKGAHNTLICTEEGGQQRMFNTEEETKGEGDKESGNTDNSWGSNIERMKQQREEEQDQGDYEEPGGNEVTDHVEMMWQTNEEDFKEELNELPEPQIEDQNIERF